MTTYPSDDEGLEATEVPTTPRSALDPDPGPDRDADAPDAADDGSYDGGPANSDPGF